MNHLAHFVLAGQSPASIVGGFLGDYVKGRLKGHYPLDIERGIQLHRAIDAYTDQHEVVKHSYRRFDPEFRRYAGIMTDIIFDHLLAKQWSQYYSTSLPDFSERTLAVLLDNMQHLPENAQATATRMHEHNSLAGYGQARFVSGSFEFISTRLTRANPLNRAFAECELHLDELNEDFHAFYPDLINYCADWAQVH